MFGPDAEHARAEAAAWVARLRADDRTGAQEREFRAWLDADPGHAAAFEQVNQTWSDIGAAAIGFRRVPVPEPSGFSRRFMLLAGLGVLGGVGTATSLLDTAEASIYRTDIGEQKHLDLGDGTSVFLDTNTMLGVTLSARKCAIALHHGRANFRIGYDPRRPVSVAADQETINAAYSSFDVSREQDRVSILLIRGNASVESVVAGAHSSQDLAQGQQLLATAGTLKLDRPDLTPLMAWQTGQAVFDGDSLARAVYEMNRYSRLRLDIRDSRVANMRLSGVYKVGDNAMFARALTQLLPVTFERQGDEILLLADEQRPGRG